MLGSPSGNLKSPQTPSQLPGMPSGPPGPHGPHGPSRPSSGLHQVSTHDGLSRRLPRPHEVPLSPCPFSWLGLFSQTPMQSPGIPQSSKPPLSMTSPNMMANVEQGANGPPPAPSNQPGSINLPGSLPSGSPYGLPPEPTLSQNPLSIMMSRMSKFAMPSSTPLYHDAIKTVASSDDDSPPARSPNLPNNCMPGMGVNHHPGHPRMAGLNPALSPMGLNSMGQPVPHAMPGQLPSPNPMGPGMMPHGMMMPHISQDPGMAGHQMMAQGRMGFPSGSRAFLQGSRPPSRSPSLTTAQDPRGGSPTAWATPERGVPWAGWAAESQAALSPSFDLSRIIPSEKPSQTLSYFPRGDSSGGKPPHPSGPPGFPHMQGMMGEGHPRMGLPMPGPGHMGPQDMPMGNPGQHGMRPPGFMPQGMMGPQHRMLSPGQHGMMGGPGMMQGKERGPLYSHPGALGSPSMVMSLHGMGGPQQTMMMAPQMRPRGLPGDMGMGFNPGPPNPGPPNPGNLMF
ncbi:hypothetical protein COCON_G00194060 [Conger conger]|uniref:Uncharacterized protein n=1 Tax=Conger conger TaxID=82655 RepID=A0A9Q1HQZ6_CONCO|nr:hypothetical protein COCON_G00194060 [Conger conger]